MMVNTGVQPAFQWLVDIERRAKQRAKGLPRQEQVQEIWRGISFRVGEVALIASIDEVREILPLPSSLAKVPGSKPWVRGLANIRGALLPVVDLQACLEGKPINVSSRARMLVINQNGMTAGLLVDEVLGIKHFPEQLRDNDTPCKESWLAPFAKGLFPYEESVWTVFNMVALSESELFLNAAL